MTASASTKPVKIHSRFHDLLIILGAGIGVAALLVVLTLIFNRPEEGGLEARILYFTIGFMVGSVLTTLIARHRQRARLRNLCALVQRRLEEADLSALPTSGEREVDLLIRGFNDLLESAQQRVKVTSTLTTAARTRAQESNFDKLTGLHNRGYLMAHLEDEVGRTKALNDVLSLIMLDVDHFKHYNDTHGHQMGDEVLLGVGHVLKKSVRALDVCVRYGGEEFVVLLPRTSLERARQTAERIRRGIATHPFAEADKQPEGTLTVSLGVACCPADAETGVELIGKADEALYAAKHAGRNCVKTAQETDAAGGKSPAGGKG